MSIRKHKTDPNKWIIDYRPKGKYGPRHQIVYEGTELEAREVEGELRRRHVSATEHRVNPPINRILPEYLDWLKLHRATRTYQDLVLSLKWLQPIFGSLPVSRITRTTVQQYQQSRNGCTGRTINKELSYLSSIIKWMCDRNLADPLPFKIEKLPHRRPLPKIPHPAELKKFMSHFDGEKRAMVLLLFLSGLRFSEMSHLKWEDILWAQKTIRLQGKGGKWRFADLPDQVAELLKPLRKDEGFVFINPETEKPYGSMKTTFKTASKKAGAKITPHLLRHACATYLLEATGDLRLVQETLGHSSVAVTEFYTHITAGRIKNGLARSREHIKKLEDEIDTGPETPTPPSNHHGKLKVLKGGKN